MNYGFSMGSAGVIAAMHRQDVATNNLANIQTIGYKPDASFTIPRQAARQEDGVMNLPSNALLERLGAGVLLSPNRVSFIQGTITKTRNPFDLAVQGEGFLTVQAAGDAGAGGAGGDNVRLTRDGRMTMDTQGRLVTATEGLPALDTNGRPITLDPAAEFTVQSDGTIMQGGVETAKLGFVDVPNKDALRKVGMNQFAVAGGAATTRVPATDRGGQVVQYAVEESGSDPIRAMMAVQGAADAVTVTSKIMQIQDDLMSRAINTLGRVTA